MATSGAIKFMSPTSSCSFVRAAAKIQRRNSFDVDFSNAKRNESVLMRQIEKLSIGVNSNEGKLRQLYTDLS